MVWSLPEAIDNVVNIIKQPEEKIPHLGPPPTLQSLYVGVFFFSWKLRGPLVEFQGKIIYAPPPSPLFLAKRHFSGEGGGGVYFEAPRGRNFIRPPPLLYTPHP